MRVRSPLSAAALLVAFTLAACERDGAGDASARDTADTAASAAQTGAASVHVDMAATGNSNVSGMAMLDRSDEAIEIALTLNGLREGQKYALHVSPGRCGDTGDRHTVKTFELEGGETRDKRVTLERSELDQAQQNYVLEVRDAANTVVTCGAIPEQAYRTTAGAPAAY